MLLKNRKNLKMNTVEPAQPRIRPAARERVAFPHAQAAAWAWVINSARARLPLGPHLAREPSGRRLPSDAIRRLRFDSGKTKTPSC